MYKPEKSENSLLSFIESYEKRFLDEPDMNDVMKNDGKIFRRALGHIKLGDFYQAGKIIYDLDTAPREAILNEIENRFPRALARYVLNGAGYRT